MTNWIVVLIASAIVFYLSLRNTLDIWVTIVMLAVSLFGVVISLTCLIVCYTSAPLQMSLFDEQKQYIEGKGGCCAVEDAALTNKKIELNAWLYSAQAARRRFGGWCVYPESVLDMTPIE